MTEAVVETDRMIADLLAGKSGQWPVKETSPDDEAMVIERVLYHGVAALLNKSAMASARWPSYVIDAIYQQAIALGMWELRHKAVLLPLLKAFHDQDIYPIILKGTAIAYDLYAQPSARQRGDTDILISRQNLAKVRLVLTSLGFKLGLALHDDANPTSLQECWDFDAEDGSHHTIDLHWSAVNSFHLENLFTYEESIQSARLLPRLSEYARSFSLVDSLLFSCVHRAEHTYTSYYMNGVPNLGNERLIWAYDIDLYASALQPSEWIAFCELAHKKEIARICLDGLQYASLSLGTQIPEIVTQSLKLAPIETDVWGYLNQQTKIQFIIMNLRAIPGFQNKLRFIVRKIFPPAAFMRSKYQHLSHRSLLTLYGIRLFEFIFAKK